MRSTMMCQDLIGRFVFLLYVRFIKLHPTSGDALAVTAQSIALSISFSMVGTLDIVTDLQCSRRGYYALVSCVVR